MDVVARINRWLEDEDAADADETLHDARDEIVALRRIANAQDVRLAGAEKETEVEGFRPYLERGLYDTIMPDSSAAVRYTVPPLLGVPNDGVPAFFISMSLARSFR